MNWIKPTFFGIVTGYTFIGLFMFLIIGVSPGSLNKAGIVALALLGGYFSIMFSRIYIIARDWNKHELD